MHVTAELHTWIVVMLPIFTLPAGSLRVTLASELKAS